MSCVSVIDSISVVTTSLNTA